jgi:sugar lactone lactonase YvrE
MGSGLHQLSEPIGIAVDGEGAMLVADSANNRVMRWVPGATQGEIVAGGHGGGSGLHQLSKPIGIAVNGEGAMLVADFVNHRVMRWVPGATQGEIAAGAKREVPIYV